MAKFDENKAFEMAQDMAKDFDEKKVAQDMDKFRGSSFFDDFKLLYKMVTDKGYKISGSTKAIIAGALMYVVVPTDLIPDFLAPLGLIDDATVVAIVMKSLSDEIESYKEYISRGKNRLFKNFS